MVKPTGKLDPKTVDLKSLLQDGRGRDALRQLSETKPFRNALRTATAGSRLKQLVTPAESRQPKQLARPAQSSLPRQPATPAESSLPKPSPTPVKSTTTVTGQKRKRHTGIVEPVLPSESSDSDFTWKPARDSKAKPTVRKTRAPRRRVRQSMPTNFDFKSPEIPVPNPFSNNNNEPQLTSPSMPSPGSEVFTRPSKFSRVDSDQNVRMVPPTDPDDCWSNIARRAYNIAMESKKAAGSGSDNETDSTVSLPSVEEIAARLGRSRLQPAVAPLDIYKTSSTISSPSPKEMAATRLGLAHLQPVTAPLQVSRRVVKVVQQTPQQRATFEMAVPVIREQEDDDCFIVATRKAQQLPGLNLHNLRQDGQRVVHPVGTNANGAVSLSSITALNTPSRRTITLDKTPRRTALPTLSSRRSTIRREPISSPQSSVTPVQSRSFRCHICGRTFMKIWNFKRHLQDEHRQSRPSQSPSLSRQGTPVSPAPMPKPHLQPRPLSRQLPPLMSQPTSQQAFTTQMRPRYQAPPPMTLPSFRELVQSISHPQTPPPRAYP